MKKKVLLLSLLLSLFSIVAGAQSGYVTVTGQIPTYSGGQVTANFVNQSTAPQLPLLNGSVFAKTAIGNLDANGKFSMAIADNLVIQPTPSQWQFILCAKTGNPSQPCYPIQISITCVGNGACVSGSLDISAAFVGAPTPFNPTINTLFTNVFFSQPGDTILSIEQECSSPCSYVVTTPQTITLASNHTLASNVNLVFAAGGSWTINGSGNTLTLPNPVQGTLTTHFLGTAAVQFGAGQTLVPVEWFGAIGDGTTDNLAAIQTAVNSIYNGTQLFLQARKYAISGTLVFNRSATGIHGMGMRVPNTNLYPNPPASILLETSASADGVQVVGSGSSNFLYYNNFDNFNIERSVVPTGTPAGLSLNYTYGATVKNFGCLDSPHCLYAHASGGQGTGVVENSVFAYGFNGVVETSGVMAGVYLDSADGQANPSFRIRHSATLVKGSVTATVYGLLATGTSINDLMTYGFETAGADYGEAAIQTGYSTVITSSDMHFVGSINDGCRISCYLIQGLTAVGGAGVEINGGYDQPATAHPAIDIESSSGVRILGVQMGVQGASNMSACIDFNNSSNDSATGNTCQGAQNVGILLNLSTNIAVTGNNLIGNNDANGLITLVGSSGNAIFGNPMGGTGQSLVVDSNSQNNTGLYSNPVQSSLSAPNIVGSNPLNVGDNVAGLHYTSTAASATATVGAGAGTGGSCTVSGNDTRGAITIHVGTSPLTVNQNLCTITFAKPFATSPYVVFSEAAGTTSTSAGATLYQTPTTTNFQINAQSGVTASTTIVLTYTVIG